MGEAESRRRIITRAIESNTASLEAKAAAIHILDDPGSDIADQILASQFTQTYIRKVEKDGNSSSTERAHLHKSDGTEVIPDLYRLRYHQRQDQGK